jgi:broad-specificity NMP kinase
MRTKFWLEKFQEKKLLENRTCRRVDNIKMDAKEVFSSCGLIHLAEDMVHW